MDAWEIEFERSFRTHQLALLDSSSIHIQKRHDSDSSRGSFCASGLRATLVHNAISRRVASEYWLQYIDQLRILTMSTSAVGNMRTIFIFEHPR